MLFLTPARASEVQASAHNNKEKVEWVALKNNLLYDAAATPNLQIEIRLTRKWSLELGAGFTPFPLDDTKFPKWRHVSAHIAPRYWFCQVFNRGFLSFNAAYAHYNVAGNAYPVAWMYPQIKDSRYQGDAVMGGLSYGWHFAISPHFSIELEGGLEAGYSWYDQYECKHCGTKKNSGGRWLLLPKVGINLSVPLGGDEASLARRCDCEKLDTAEPVDSLSADTTDSAELREPLLPAERLMALMVVPAPIATAVPPIRLQEDEMQRLRNRVLRREELYEPYDIHTALSADPRNVFLYFDVNVTKMDRSFIANDRLMDSIMTILGEALADSTIRITRIQIVGFASFDGRQTTNERLAGNRANTIKNYIRSLYPLEDSLFTVCNGGESWAELRYQLEKVNFDGKEEILRIIDEVPDPDQREIRIKQFRQGGTYRYMRDNLKRILRNLGCITIYFEDNN